MRIAMTNNFFLPRPLARHGEDSLGGKLTWRKLGVLVA
jgi:hypothetical protein